MPEREATEKRFSRDFSFFSALGVVVDGEGDGAEEEAERRRLRIEVVLVLDEEEGFLSTTATVSLSSVVIGLEIWVELVFEGGV